MEQQVFVLFEVTVRGGRMEDYLAQAGQLKAFLENAPGFICAERFSSLVTEGKLLSLSVWENEESVSNWRNLLEHRQRQQHGRKEDFADYAITVASPVRRYTMNERKEAPVDSNQYFYGEV